MLGSCVQRRYSPHTRTYLGPGKIVDVMAAVNATNARTLVIDDDLTSKQQRNLEEALSANGGSDVKVCIILSCLLYLFWITPPAFLLSR